MDFEREGGVRDKDERWVEYQEEENDDGWDVEEGREKEEQRQKGEEVKNDEQKDEERREIGVTTGREGKRGAGVCGLIRRGRGNERRSGSDR